MSCSRVTHRTVGPLLYCANYNLVTIMFWSCQKEFLFNSDNDENSGQPVLVGLENEMVYLGRGGSPSWMKAFISIANYKIVLLFTLPNMFIYFILTEQSVRFQINSVYVQKLRWFLWNEEFFSAI